MKSLGAGVEEELTFCTGQMCC